MRGRYEHTADNRGKEQAERASSMMEGVIVEETRMEKRLRMAKQMRVLVGEFNSLATWDTTQAGLCRIAEALAVMLEELP